MLVKWCLNFIENNRAAYYKFLYPRQIDFGQGVMMASGTSILMVYENKISSLKIGSATNFRRFCTLTLDGKCELNIGNNNFFNNGCSINCLGYVKIGNYNLFGEGVKIYDHNHLFRDKNVLVQNQGFSIGKVEIGNNCWVGSNTVILNNVIIGDNVIIGANNLIYKSIPSNSIVKSNTHGVVDYYI